MNYTLKDLLDLPKLQDLLDSLDEIQSLPSAIIDMEGNILTATAWQDICTKFHRVNPDIEKMCIDSDLRIELEVADKMSHVIYHCPMGLVDTATPIIIEGRHLGNVFTGQLFLEPPDEEQFKAKARQYGFDKGEYLAAMRKVPILSEEKLHKNLAFIAKLAQMLAEQGLQNLRLLETEESLRRSEEKFYKAFKANPEAFSITSLEDGSYIEVNDTFLELTGLQIDEIIGHTSRELNFWVDLNERQLFLEKLTNNGSIKDFEARYRIKNNEIRDFLVSSETVDLQGIKCGVSFIKDITERKIGEKALQESKDLLSEIIDMSPISMAIVNMDGTIEHINHRAIETFGYLPDDIPNMHRWWMQAYPDESYRTEVIAQWMGLVGKAMDEKSDIERREYRVNCKDGSVKMAIIFGIMVSDKIFVIFDDITDRKKAEDDRLLLERQLLHAQKMESLGVLAGGIAHDFNNILTSIMGNISYAKMDLDPSQQQYEPLNRAEKAAKRAAGLAKQLLVFARGGEPLKRVISTQKAVKEAVSFVLSGSMIEMAINLPTDLLAINADEGQIIQAFHNITLNAVQSMPNGGRLTVSGRNISLITDNSLGLPAGNYVMISFKDMGCGIEAEDLGKIFDPYFTNKPGGSGLGLASTYSIIKKHEGHITVSSSSGSGTTFTVFLPGHDSPVPEEAEESPATTGSHGADAILVMDDDEMVRELAEISLKRCGYKVVCCPDGAGAVFLYRSAHERGEPFSLAIMDLTIPGGMGGIEAAKQILAFDPEARLIVSSGYSDDPVMGNFAAYGFCASLEKPYNVEEIALILKRNLLRIT